MISHGNKSYTNININNIKARICDRDLLVNAEKNFWPLIFSTTYKGYTKITNICLNISKVIAFR